DRVGHHHSGFYIALVLYITIGIHVPLHMMRIHSISSKTNGILGGLKRFAVPLGHDIIADHPSGFPDVELLRPSVGSAKFVFRGAPSTDLIAYFFRNSWMVGKGPHQAFLVVTV